MTEQKNTTKKKVSNKKEVTKKKPAHKKNVKKLEQVEKVETKETIINNVVEQPTEEVVEEINEKVEVINGDPSVVVPENNVKEENETVTKKIINKVSQYFGYLWNGQTIDY